MVIAMTCASMMQMSGNQVIGMIPVRHLLMAAILRVLVTLVVTGARMVRCAFSGSGRIHGEHMFVGMAGMRRMQMSIVKVIDVPIVSDCLMSTIWSMAMRFGMLSVRRAAECQRNGHDSD